jgi:hypothetical protein
MGGVLGTGQAAVGDTDGDGQLDLVTISGGRVTATQPSGTTLWQGPLSGARTILGIWRMQSGQASQVVVDTTAGVDVLDGADGHKLTTLPTSAPARGAFVPEGSSGGILVLGMSRSLMQGYDFRSGTNVTAPLWSVGSENPMDAVPGDVDGDGTVDLVRTLDSGFDVLDPLTGAVKYQATAIGPTAYFYEWQLADVDGQPGLEIVAVDTSYYYSPSTGIYVLGVRNGALTTLWSAASQPTLALGADFYTVAGSVADLDGDGHKEAVFSQWDAGTQTWTTQVVNAASGAPIASLPGQLLQAVADVDGKGKPSILVRSNPLADRSPARSDLRAYDLPSATGGLVARNWVLPHAHVMTLSGSVYWQSGALDVPVASSFDSAAGVDVLVGRDDSQAGVDTSLGVLNGAGSVGATWATPKSVIPSVLAWGSAITSKSSQGDVVTFGNDGVGHVLAQGLVEQAHFDAGSYTNWLAVYGLDKTHAMLAMATSNRDLLWLDGARLQADGTPHQIAHVASVVDTSAAATSGDPYDPMTFVGTSPPTLVALQQGETNVTMIGMDQTGIQNWRTDLAPGTWIWIPGPYAGVVNSAGETDLVVPTININNLESLAIFQSTTGMLKSSTPLKTIDPAADDTTTGSLVDVNGDGIADLVTPAPFGGQNAIDLTTDPMHAIWTIPGTSLPGLSGTIAAVDVDGQGASLLRFDGNLGSGSYGRFSLNGTLIASQDEGLPNAGGVDTNALAFVERTKGAKVFDMVSAGTSGPGLSRVRRIAGDTLSTVWTEYVANGAVSSMPPAQAFALHDPISVDVDGDGTDEVVFGSDDGRLYALHAADGSLLFSIDLSAPVVHVIAADIDLDPAVELVVSLADGSLVALDEGGKYLAPRATQ